MCEPATAALALGALGTVVSAAGAIQQGQAARAAGDYQAQVARNNAQIARNNQILAERSAKDAERRGRIEEQKQDAATRQLIGRQRAALAANGVDVNFGSAVDIQGDTAEIGKLDALTIRNNAAREAAGFRARGMNFAADGNNFDASASLASAAGRNAQMGSFFSAGATVLSGFGSVAQKWYDFNPPQTTTTAPGFAYYGGPR